MQAACMSRWWTLPTRASWGGSLTAVPLVNEVLTACLHYTCTRFASAVTAFMSGEQCAVPLQSVAHVCIRDAVCRGDAARVKCALKGNVWAAVCEG